MLQRLTEDLEYHELLDKAVKCESSTEQMCFVAAFSVSSYSTTVHRTAKPFNPLLGETYELDRLEELGFRSLCEQVSCAEGLRVPVLLFVSKQPFCVGDAAPPCFSSLHGWMEPRDLVSFLFILQSFNFQAWWQPENLQHPCVLITEYI